MKTIKELGEDAGMIAALMREGLYRLDNLNEDVIKLARIVEEVCERLIAMGIVVEPVGPTGHTEESNR